MSSWQVGSTCYSTQQAALQASASSVSGTLAQVGGSAHVVTVTGVSSTAVDYTYTPLGGGSPVTVQVPQVPQPCNLLTLSDASPIGWAICLGWVSIFIIKSLVRAVPNDS